MREFLNTYGVWAAFLLALIESDLVFIAIGVVAKLGGENPLAHHLDLSAAVPAAIAGALIHDSVWFSLGHFNSSRIRASGIYRRVGPIIERLAKRFGLWEIFLARFIYGTRNPSSVFWGIQRVPWFRFAGVELLALSVWGGILATIGFHSTGWALKVLGKAETRHHPHVLLVAVVVIAAVVALLRIFNRRRLATTEKRAP